MPITITHFTNSILKDITFSLPLGEHLVILGANGVGKTTLAKVLCGITPSDSVTIDGISPSKVYGNTRAKLINYIPPKLDVFDEFITVKEFLELGIIHTEERKEQTIDNVLNTLHISHLKEKSCQSLSSGESQLLLLASALLHHASYTIFDEPTANLDPQKMQMLFTILKEPHIQASKIIITHNLDLAYKLGFPVLFLKEGNIQFYGSTQTFFAAENLERIYQGAVVNDHGNIVVKL